MELILAGQSVHIKCRIQASILMGNYEFYYACGWLCAIAGTSLSHALPPRELYSFIKPLFDTYKPKDAQEAYLVKMLKEYRVLDEYDEQMPELFQMGFSEKNLDNS